MTDETPETSRSLTAALTEAATAAGYAPSVHNTQPWRWRVQPDGLELYAVRDRQLAVTDPDGRLLAVSCGTGLHHARVALAAQGWAARVTRLPDPADPDLLARIVVTGPSAPTSDAVELAACLRERHTDRRPVSTEPVPTRSLDAIRKAVADEDLQLHILGANQVYELAAAASRAAEVEAKDPVFQQELQYWTTRTGPAGTGLPAEVLPAHAAETTVPGRDFGREGTLPVGPGHDRAAAYGLLYGDEDEPKNWLRAGEALSAAWLTATRLGVSVVPLSAVVEVVSTRHTLRRLLADLGYPYLALRLGIADPAQPAPPHTPRMPVTQVVDTSAVPTAGTQ
ncbi:NAD(P)H nitroreductase [Micromonospora sonneratiae]|uniref:Acg family FMN-binding oxidoreductase n=1 Tax=Micromonospora sonneratiae TaxID=1184706 RepID=A0ABW3Y9D0_9ACTN